MKEISTTLRDKIHYAVMQLIVVRHREGNIRILKDDKPYLEQDYVIATSNLAKFAHYVFIISKLVPAAEEVYYYEKGNNLNRFYAFDLLGKRYDFHRTEYPQNFLDTLNIINDYSSWFEEQL